MMLMCRMCKRTWWVGSIQKKRQMGGREKDGKEGAKDKNIEEDAEERAVSEGPSEKDRGHRGEKARGSVQVTRMHRLGRQDQFKQIRQFANSLARTTHTLEQETILYGP